MRRRQSDGRIPWRARPHAPAGRGTCVLAILLGAFDDRLVEMRKSLSERLSKERGMANLVQGALHGATVLDDLSRDLKNSFAVAFIPASGWPRTSSSSVSPGPLLIHRLAQGLKRQISATHDHGYPLPRTVSARFQGRCQRCRTCALSEDAVSRKQGQEALRISASDTSTISSIPSHKIRDGSSNATRVARPSAKVSSESYDSSFAAPRSHEPPARRLPEPR